MISLISLSNICCEKPLEVKNLTLSAEVKALSYVPDTSDIDVGFTTNGDISLTPRGSPEMYIVVINTKECGLLSIKNKKLFQTVKLGDEIEVKVEIRTFKNYTKCYIN